MKGLVTLLLILSAPHAARAADVAELPPCDNVTLQQLENNTHPIPKDTRVTLGRKITINGDQNVGNISVNVGVMKYDARYNPKFVDGYTTAHNAKIHVVKFSPCGNDLCPVDVPPGPSLDIEAGTEMVFTKLAYQRLGGYFWDGSLGVWSLPQGITLAVDNDSQYNLITDQMSFLGRGLASGAFSSVCVPGDTIGRGY